MDKYQVIIHLMKDPSKGDATFPRYYEVKANSTSDAIDAAEKIRDTEEADIRCRSAFDYTVTKIQA